MIFRCTDPSFLKFCTTGGGWFFRSARDEPWQRAGLAGGCHARSQQMRRGGKKSPHIASRSSWNGWSGCTEGRRVGRERERERGGSEGHPLIPSLTQRSFACMEVGEGGNFIACLSVRRSVGGMGSQSQKWSMSALDARTRGLRNVATLPKCLFARPRLSDRGNTHSLLSAGPTWVSVD